MPDIYAGLNDTLKGVLQGFSLMRVRSELGRLKLYRDMAAFLNNDFESIKEILREVLSNQFKKETLDRFIYQHINIIKKTLYRITGGIYTQDPIRELIPLVKEPTSGDAAGGAKEPLPDEKFAEILTQTKYASKVKEAFRKAGYYNIVLVQPVWDEEQKAMRIDIHTPDMFATKTKEDYLLIDELYLQKARPDGTVYTAVWSDEKHYLLEGTLEAVREVAVEGNEQMVNPYKKVPAIVLRLEEGLDFYGEPNWNLYLNQQALDIKLTNFFHTELKQHFGIYFGVNTEFSPDESFNAGEFKQRNKVGDEEKDPSLQVITPDVQWKELKDNHDWLIKAVLMSEGLPASSSSTEKQDLSGAAKKQDEVELHERRADFKGVLYDFEMQLMEMIRIVYNTHNTKDKLPEKAKFNLVFTEEEEYESPQDKAARRETENYKDIIDFVMEDEELSEDEAIDYLKKRKERAEKYKDIYEFFDKTPEALQDPEDPDAEPAPGKQKAGESK